MSATNVFATAERALIFTDAAAYDLKGRLVTFFDKAEVVEDCQLVVTGRGNAFFPRLVAGMIARLGWTVDEIESDGGELFEEAFRGSEHLMIDVGKAFNDCNVTGWSKAKNRPIIMVWTNTPPPDANGSRFWTHDSVMAPDLTEEGYARVQKAMGPMSKAKVDMERLGLEIMKAQRFATGSAEFGSEGQYLVGGHIQRTDVTATGITKRIVHSWPEDRIGERIRPVPDIDAASSPNVSAMNRADRRRLAKTQKRRAA